MNPRRARGGHRAFAVGTALAGAARQELANLCPDTIDEAAQLADEGLCRIGSETELGLAFLRHTGLQL